MQQQILTVKSNSRLNGSVFEMELEGDRLQMRPGQFVELSVDGLYLRRPMSVCDCSENGLTVVYKIVGVGTEKMAGFAPGEKINALTHLGNGFDFARAERPLLVGGGIGCAPLYMLAKKFAEKGIRPQMILGFRNAGEIFYADRFQKLGVVTLATDDGSCGEKGNAVCIAEKAAENGTLNFDTYFACGPAVMLDALRRFGENGQLSLEARMGCGFGACMGCSVKTKSGFKRVCKEGPVFDAADMLFD